MTRDEMIQQLIQDRLEHEGDLQRYLWLQNVLENGFCGFANMPDELLARKFGTLSASTVRRSAIVDVNRCEYDDECGDDESLLASSFAMEYMRLDPG